MVHSAVHRNFLLASSRSVAVLSSRCRVSPGRDSGRGVSPPGRSNGSWLTWCGLGCGVRGWRCAYIYLLDIQLKPSVHPHSYNLLYIANSNQFRAGTNCTLPHNAQSHHKTSSRHASRTRLKPYAHPIVCSSRTPMRPHRGAPLQPWPRLPQGNTAHPGWGAAAHSTAINELRRHLQSCSYPLMLRSAVIERALGRGSREDQIIGQ